MANKYRNRYKSHKEDYLATNCNYDKCCNDPNIISNEEELVCINCGLVVDKNIVDNEKRAYTSEEIEQRTRTEPRWREFGPRTFFQNINTDSKGQYLDANGKNLFSRLSKIQKSLISSIERNFWEAKPKLNMFASKLNLPDFIKDTAWKIYSVAAKKKLTMGRTIDGFIAASLYAAIRIHEFPRLFDEICDISMTDSHTIHRSLGLIIKEVLPELGLKYHPITAEQLVFKFGNDLGLSMETLRQASYMLIDATKNGLIRTGKDPKGFAASVIYIAAKDSNERKTQTEVSEIAKITEVTLRSRVKDIIKSKFV
jgi:transcription initiation factor TFIIB